MSAGLKRRGRPKTKTPAGALAWSVLNVAASRLGTLGIGIVLARLLGPAEFGKFAIAMVALLAVLSFNELGVSLAIVRWPEDPAAIAGTVTTISVAMSALLTALAWFVAPSFAGLMGDPGSTVHIQLLSLCVLVNGFVATPAALLQRHFHQDRRMLIDQVNVWLGALTSVGLALLGVGALSLVIGRLVGASVSGLLFWWFSPLPYRFGFDRAHIRPLLSFGAPLAGASALVFAAGFVDQIVVGAVLGPVALGYYLLALNVSNWPVTLFSQPLRAIVPAVLARLQGNPTGMRSAFLLTVRPLAVLTLPACAGAAAAAPQIVGFLYGEQWLAAAGPLRWLALLACIRIFCELMYDYLVILGRSSKLMLLQGLSLIVVLPAAWLGARTWGIAGAAGAQLAGFVVMVLPLYGLLMRRESVSLLETARQIVPALLGTLTLVCLILLSADAGFARLQVLFVSGAAGGIAVALLLMLSRSHLRSLRTLSRSVTES